MKSPYETLGVDKDATPDQVKRAFRKKVKRVHPDAGGSDKDFHEVESAYAVLANPVRRQRFDETGKTDSEASFRQKVVTELQALLVIAIQHTDWQHDDLIACMKQAMAGKIREISKNKADAKKAAVKWIDAIKRCSRKDNGENVIVTALENEKRQCETAMKRCDEVIEVLEAVTVELDLYQWRVDKRPEKLTEPAFFAREFTNFVMSP